VAHFVFFVAHKQGGDTSYVTLFYVSLGITLVAFALALFVPTYAIFILPVVCAWAIQKFCSIGWLRSIVATILFMAWVVSWPVIFDKMLK